MEEDHKVEERKSIISKYANITDAFALKNRFNNSA